MCVLTALVGLNYMVICRLYPDGGGVYASVRHRSEVISIVGAFLLIADYLVTAAISALSAFAYLGVPHPEKFAALALRIARLDGARVLDLGVGTGRTTALLRSVAPRTWASMSPRRWCGLPSSVFRTRTCEWPMLVISGRSVPMRPSTS